MIKDIDSIMPLGDFIVVTQFNIKLDSRIVLPGDRDGENTTFEVLRTGPGKMLDSGERKAMSVGVGDIIIFAGSTPVMPLYVSKERRSVYLLNDGNVVAKVGNVSTTERAPDPEAEVRVDLTNGN